MAEDMFDVIIVGGGIAGCTAACKLAREGLGVLLVERGNSIGNKNMTGGRLYTHSLEKIIPEIATQAPVERRIVVERYTYEEDGSQKTAERREPGLCFGGESYSVLGAVFDKWLGERAEEEGAMVVTGIRVDDLLVRDGRVCGIVAGEDEMESRVVILADGVNSLLAQKIGLKGELTEEETEVGAKEVLAMDSVLIEERFGLNPGEGLQWILEGQSSFGQKGTGFLYTNRDSISVGILTGAEEISASGQAVADLVDRLKENPAVKPYLEGAKLAEYSAHLLTKGNSGSLSKLSGNGVLVIGDAAGMAVNRGYLVRGMDLAVESALLAAETILEADGLDDFSEKTLSAYDDKVRQSFIVRDMDREEPYDGTLEKIFR